MKHVKALLIKFVGTFAILYLVVGYFYALNIIEVLFLSALLGVTAYLFGDMLILPRTNNLIGALVDFGLAWALIYLFINMMTDAGFVFTMSLVTAIILSLFEIAFHIYLGIYVFPDKDNEKPEVLHYQTEMSGELGEPALQKRREESPRS